MANSKRKGATTLYELLDQSKIKEAATRGVTATPAPQPASPSRSGEEKPTISDAEHARGESGSIKMPPAAPPIAPTTAAPPTPPIRTATRRIITPPVVKPPIQPRATAGKPQDLMQTIRTRPWLPIAIALAAILLVLVIIRWSGRLGTNLPPEMPPVGRPTVDLQPHLEPVPFTPPATPTSAVTGQVHSEAGNAAASVVPTSAVTRQPNDWYLVILTTLPQYAQRDAEFIARHGVSVSVIPGRHLAMVVSVEGFADRASQEAIQLRRRVMNIGALLPESRKIGHSIWSDAYYAHIK